MDKMAEKWTNILLLITMFFVVSGFIYWALGLFNITIGLMRYILAVIISLIIGLGIYLNGKSPKR